MIIIGLSALVTIVGLLMYVLAGNPKVQEIGRIMFFCGLLALLLSARSIGGIELRG